MSVRQFASMALSVGIGLAIGPASYRSPAAASGAAGGIIEGHVSDRASQPIPGASVTMIPETGGLAQYAVTDRDGAYRFEGLADGNYRVDFELPGFVGLRRNHVRVRAAVPANVDAALSIRPVCECLTIGPVAQAVLAGEVVDDAGRALPHARLEVTSEGGAEVGAEVAYAGSDGRFLMHLPLAGALKLTAADSGFSAVMQQISRTTTEPLLLKLRFRGTENIADTERFNAGCACPGYFAHQTP